MPGAEISALHVLSWVTIYTVTGWLKQLFFIPTWERDFTERALVDRAGPLKSDRPGFQSYVTLSE